MASSLSSSPNAPLIGSPGSRARLITPALVLDLDAFERNLERMARFAASRRVTLRPHAKTHKCVEIARRQIAAGAVGVCCATLDEAEAMIWGGAGGVLITSPLGTPAKRARLAELLDREPRLMVVIDDRDEAAALEGAIGDRTLEVLIDVDVGQGRTGVPSVEGAVALASRVQDSPRLFFAGLQAYAGHLQHVVDLGERRRRVREVHARIEACIEGLRTIGIAPRIVSGSGTGTHDLDAEAGLFSELQVGSYLFMDVEYGTLEQVDGEPPFETSLFVASAVVSRNASGYVTTDGGLKAFATDGPPPRITRGAPPGAGYAYQGDEHGKVVIATGEGLPLGALVECETPHCDPNVNLYAFYHCVRGDTLVDIWPVVGRRR